jgi:hypothetical protein
MARRKGGLGHDEIQNLLDLSDSDSEPELDGVDEDEDADADVTEITELTFVNGHMVNATRTVPPPSSPVASRQVLYCNPDYFCSK